MGKARLNKTFGRADYAATEDDFEETMARAIAASQQEEVAASSHDVAGAPARKGKRQAAASAGGRRSRSHSRSSALLRRQAVPVNASVGQPMDLVLAGGLTATIKVPAGLSGGADFELMVPTERVIVCTWKTKKRPKGDIET